MNTNMSRRGRYAMLAVAAAASSVIFLPLAQGVASASAGYHTVQAGGPPAPAPVRHVTKVRHVPKEKRVLHNPRFHMPRIRVIIHNRNHNKNRRHELRHHRPARVQPQEVEVNNEVPEEEVENGPEYDGRWWWPNELR